jgi:hypothetical protein
LLPRLTSFDTFLEEQLMIQRLALCALVFVALAMFVAPAAQACDGGCGCGWDYGYGYLYNILRYEVPHFAAFPPVYYSYPVPRTYGYGPFAYPPYVRTPDIVAEAEPVTIINPHVPKSDKETAKPKVDRTAAAGAHPEPLVVVNPFVAQSRTLAQSN